jgi:hypothetical protein
MVTEGQHKSTITSAEMKFRKWTAKYDWNDHIRKQTILALKTEPHESSLRLQKQMESPSQQNAFFPNYQEAINL